MSPSPQDEFMLAGPPRVVDAQTVRALDDALALAAGSAASRLLHVYDPRRIIRFENGGPPVWSVAVCPSPMPTPGFLFVTYGLSRYIDPQSPFGHEVSIRVEAPDPKSRVAPSWPPFFLRHLARYQLTTGRELCIGDPMTFSDPITKTAVSPDQRHTQPDSTMFVVAMTADPAMPRVKTPQGTQIEVRRVYGLFLDELELIEPWSCRAFTDLIARRDPSLTTAMGRPSWMENQELVAEAEQGSARDGSQTPAIVIPGIRWGRRDQGYVVRIPGGPTARRFAKALHARLAFGRRLLAHDFEELPFSTLAFEPSDQPWVQEQGDKVLVLGLTKDTSPLRSITGKATLYEWHIDR